MKHLFFLSLFIFSVCLSAQEGIPLNCDEFSLKINSNTANSIGFISEEKYFSIIKNSIKISKPTAIKENADLYREFQEKFPKKITRHCINSKYDYNEGIKYLSYCDDATTLTLINKEYNFYIFKEKGYETDHYLLFNTQDQIIYSTTNYPVILEKGGLVFDIGDFYNGLQVINYYKFTGTKTEYLQCTLPLHYTIQDFRLVNQNGTVKVVVDIIKHHFKKKIVNNHAEFYIDDYCRKFLLIE